MYLMLRVIINFNFVAEHCLLMPVEYRALHTVFSTYNKKIMDVWRSVYNLRVVTLHIVTQLLRSKKLTIVARDLKGKFNKGITTYMQIQNFTVSSYPASNFYNNNYYNNIIPL